MVFGECDDRIGPSRQNFEIFEIKYTINDFL